MFLVIKAETEVCSIGSESAGESELLVLRGAKWGRIFSTLAAMFVSLDDACGSIILEELSADPDKSDVLASDFAKSSNWTIVAFCRVKRDVSGTIFVWMDASFSYFDGIEFVFKLKV